MALTRRNEKKGVGNTLKRHYETYLLEYELAHDDVDGECCLLYQVLAKEVDASGERTFGVLTKLDLMDKGTNALDVLEGGAYRLQHPWVGIANRSQADISKSVDMIATRRKEEEYFATCPEYGHLASKMGSEYLAKLLSKTVIRARIPSIIALINKTVDELEAELDRLGRPIGVDAAVKRPGGDRIYVGFDNQLPAALKKLPFDRHLSLQNVRKVVSRLMAINLI